MSRYWKIILLVLWGNSKSDSETLPLFILHLFSYHILFLSVFWHSFPCRKAGGRELHSRHFMTVQSAAETFTSQQAFPICPSLCCSVPRPRSARRDWWRASAAETRPGSQPEPRWLSLQFIKPPTNHCEFTSARVERRVRLRNREYDWNPREFMDVRFEFLRKNYGGAKRVGVNSTRRRGTAPNNFI